jgi:hypothetical protein
VKGLAILATGIVVAASCGRRAPGTTEPAPIVGAAPVSAIDTTQPAARDAFRRANEAAAQVDTIVARPDSLTLRVGQTIQPWAAITIEARNAAGARVTNFAPLMRVEDQTVVEQRPAGLVARRAGRTTLVISPISIDPAVRVRDVRAVVVLNVVP